MKRRHFTTDLMDDGKYTLKISRALTPREHRYFARPLSAITRIVARNLRQHGYRPRMPATGASGKSSRFGSSTLRA
jgi:hypothetical protein